MVLSKKEIGKGNHDMDVFRKIDIINANRSLELLEYADEYTKLNFIYGALLLSGSSIKKSEVLKIMRGDIVMEASIRDHAKIENYMVVLKHMNRLIEMDLELETRYIMELSTMLFGIDKNDFRRSNPTFREFSYTPPHFREVERLMKDLDRWIVSNEANKDFFRKLSGLYLKIIEICPLDENNHELANMLICYEFKKRGLPPSGIIMKMADYEKLMKRYFISKNQEGVYLHLYEMQEKQLDHIIERFDLKKTLI